MATHTIPASGGVHPTLSATTADTVVLPQGRTPKAWLVRNRDTTNGLWVRLDGTTAVADADSTLHIPAENYRIIDNTHGQDLSIVGNGNVYDVEPL